MLSVKLGGQLVLSIKERQTDTQRDRAREREQEREGERERMPSVQKRLMLRTV